MSHSESKIAFWRDHAQIDMACTLFGDTLDKGKRDDEIFSQEQAVAFRKPICLHQFLSEGRSNSRGLNEAFPINALRRNEIALDTNGSRGFLLDVETKPRCIFWHQACG
jgi:hypothetical protein